MAKTITPELIDGEHGFGSGLEEGAETGLALLEAAAGEGLAGEEGDAEQEDEAGGSHPDGPDVAIVPGAQHLREAGGVGSGDGRIAGRDGGELALGGDLVEGVLELSRVDRPVTERREDVIETERGVDGAEGRAGADGPRRGQKLAQEHVGEQGRVGLAGAGGLDGIEGGSRRDADAAGVVAGDLRGRAAGNREAFTVESGFVADRERGGEDSDHLGGPPRLGHEELAAALLGGEADDDVEAAAAQGLVVGDGVADDAPIEGVAGARCGGLQSFDDEAVRLAGRVAVAHGGREAERNPEFLLRDGGAGQQRKQGKRLQTDATSG